MGEFNLFDLIPDEVRKKLQMMKPSENAELRAKHLKQMMEEFPGSQPPGTWLQRVGKRWRQTDKPRPTA